MRWIKRNEGCDLPLRMRLAWAAWLVEHALNYYSSYFRETFLQADAIDFTWTFVSTTVDGNEKSVQGIRKKIDALYGRAEQEGYSIESLACGDELLVEIEERDGRSAVAAAEYAAAAFSNAVVYRSGTNICNPEVDPNYQDEIVESVLDVARRAFEWAKSHPADDINRHLFDEFALPAKFRRFEVSDESRKLFPPPLHERQ